MKKLILISLLFFGLQTYSSGGGADALSNEQDFNNYNYDPEITVVGNDPDNEQDFNNYDEPEITAIGNDTDADTDKGFNWFQAGKEAAVIAVVCFIGIGIKKSCFNKTTSIEKP